MSGHCRTTSPLEQGPSCLYGRRQAITALRTSGLPVAGIPIATPQAMLQIALSMLVLTVGGLGLAFCAAARAPKGYEDATGFHFEPERQEKPEHFPGAVPELSH